MKKIKIIFFIVIAMFLINCNYVRSNNPAKETKVLLKTTLGDIIIALNNETPQHRDNFIKLVNEGFYDSLLFHRVIKEFMIQGGDPNSKNARPDDWLGGGGSGYTIPAEFVPEYIHKRGAIAAARMDDKFNPTKASSGSQFYIVQGKTFTDAELDQVEVRIGQQYARQMFAQYQKEEEEAMQKAGQKVDPDSAQMRAFRRASAWLIANPYHMKEEHRQIYKTIGGTPHLDGEYTVFGEVVKGMEVVDKIAELETDDISRPKIDVRIKRMKVK